MSVISKNTVIDFPKVMSPQWRMIFKVKIHRTITYNIIPLYIGFCDVNFLLWVHTDTNCWWYIGRSIWW